MKKGEWVLIFIALVLRVLLFVFDFNETFGYRKEIVTPNTDFKRLVEGLFLVKLNLNPYAGDAFHQPPLLLALFYPIQSNPIIIRSIFVLVDLAIAFLLSDITKRWQQRNAKNLSTPEQKDRLSTLSRSNLSELVMFVYLFNPFTIFTCVAMSTVVFNNLAIVLAIFFCFRGNQTLMTFFVAAATYLTLYPFVLIFPLSNLLQKRNLFSNILFTCIWMAGLIGVSYQMFQDWNFLMESYGFNLMVSDLSPNIGIFWYFFTEVFKNYRNFYLFAYQYHAFMYAIPLYLRLRHHPMFLLWVNLAIMAAFKSYPSIGDIALQIAFVPLTFDKIRGNKYVFLVGIVSIFAMVLAPIFWLMWIYQGTGNANFYYAINLVTTVAQILFITDSLAVVLKDDYFSKKKQRTQVDGKKNQ